MKKIPYPKNDPGIIEAVEEYLQQADMCEIAATHGTPDPGVFNTVARGAHAANPAGPYRSYNRPMFQILAPGSSSSMPVMHTDQCPDCDNWAYSMTRCTVHADAPDRKGASRKAHSRGFTRKRDGRYLTFAERWVPLGIDPLSLSVTQPHVVRADALDRVYRWELGSGSSGRHAPNDRITPDFWFVHVVAGDEVALSYETEEEGTFYAVDPF